MILNAKEKLFKENFERLKNLDDYKGFVFEVRLINVLFSANITNDTQNIFITCQNLTSAKKALINDKIYYLLGIINLNEIKQ